jgi:uncharacterized membrane protein YraQ (UPF0718 family)
MPRWGFLIIENIFELILVVIAGIFAATLLEKHLSRLEKIVPRNIFTAFIYASIIPVCSCSAIPLLRSFEGKIPPQVTLTFILAAPILNPHIIILSLSLLGVKYTILRVMGSFIIAAGVAAIASGYIRRYNRSQGLLLPGCLSSGGCHKISKGVYDSAYRIIKAIFPYMLLAGILSILFESFVSKDILSHGMWGGYGAVGAAVLVGIPLYMCNGSDVIFLKPLIQYGHFPIGAAVAFSLTSTAVCISSLMLISRYLGKKLTMLILASILVISLTIGLVIQLLL